MEPNYVFVQRSENAPQIFIHRYPSSAHASREHARNENFFQPERIKYQLMSEIKY